MFLAIIVLFLITITMAAFTTWFSTKTSYDLTKLDGYSKNDDLQTAHKYFDKGTIAYWIGLPIVIVLLILLLIFGIEFLVAPGGSAILIPLLLGVMGLALYGGIYAFLGTIKITKSGAKSDDAGSYNNVLKNAIITASLSLGMIISVLIIVILKLSSKSQ